MRYTLAVFLSLTLLMSAVTAYPHRGGTDSVDIKIVSDEGEEFLTIPFNDLTKGRTHVLKKYLEAEKEKNYSITIRNNSSGRIGVVIAVDGRNIITGRKSLLKNNERMYIINPYGHTKLDGWRTDNNTIHRFYFTDKSDSYAVRTFGDSSAMGVIALAVFREKEDPEIRYKKQSLDRKAPAARSQGKSFKSYESNTAGTGFGNEKYSPVISVRFKPETAPFMKTLVKYEWHEALCEKGILKCWPVESNRLWDEEQYAPYPPGYTCR